MQTNRPTRGYTGHPKAARLSATLQAAPLLAAGEPKRWTIPALSIAMVVLRATQKLLKSWPVTAEDDDVSNTALGDWYANRIIIDRRHLVLLLSANSRLAVLTSARDVRSLPGRLPELVAARLGRLGIAESLIRLEVGAMSVARVGRTKDRSLTGQMVDFAKAIPYYLPVNDWDESTLELAEDQLGETPCLCARSFAETIFPVDMTKKLLVDHWQALKAVS